jgi:ABC-type sugar transport system ATPase subunit
MSELKFEIPELQTARSASKQTKFVLIIGTNGTGKSTFCAGLAERTVLMGGRVLIITPHDREWSGVPFLKYEEIRSFRRIKKHIFDEEKTFELLGNYKHGLLIFDDCRAYTQSNTVQDLHALLIRRRQHDLNIIAVGHGFTEIPPKFFTFATDIVLFRTCDNIARRRDVIQDFPKMLAAQNEVNERAKMDRFTYKIVKQ